MRSALLGAAVLACGGDAGGPGGAGRSYRMGFSAIPARPDTAVLIPTIELWSQRADAGLIQLSIPWTVLLDDTAAAVEVRIVRRPLVDYFRAKGLRIVVTLDITDGLNRAAEAPELVAAGRSITDTMVQRLYREYVAAVDSILSPDYLSLAAETNLIRLAAPPPVYAAAVAMVNAAAAERKSAGSTTSLAISVQVETAWGVLGALQLPFQGIAQDRADFPFLDALGLSSYPYLGGFPDPDSIPLNYYARLVEGDPVPVFVLEGGWSSVPVSPAAASPGVQAAYIARHGRILNQARAAALFQITFTDFDLSAFPDSTATALFPFAHLGIVDSALNPKPALAVWDSLYALPLVP
jgi:hypothetical protein